MVHIQANMLVCLKSSAYHERKIMAIAKLVVQPLYLQIFTTARFTDGAIFNGKLMVSKNNYIFSVGLSHTFHFIASCYTEACVQSQFSG